MTPPTIGINDFAKRHTKESELSHFEGSDSVLIELAQTNFAQARDGFRDGVFLVSVDPQGFFSSIVPITEENADRVLSKFSARRNGEKPYLSHVVSGGSKVPARQVDLVLYHKDVLGGDATTEADWEIVSINADATTEPAPMHPVTMARNFLEQEGGTKGDYSPEEFAKSIDYWASHAHIEQ